MALNQTSDRRKQLLSFECALCMSLHSYLERRAAADSWLDSGAILLCDANDLLIHTMYISVKEGT